MSSYQAPARLGRYELLGHLATGGMAEIHLARQTGTEGFERVFVVKRLLPELTASREYIAMLFDEGRIAGRLNHPNVCEVYEMGRDGAESFLVMPYLEGVPVQDLIARPREADRIAELRLWAGILVQVCAGLHYAHELRDDKGTSFELVHRDISPSNLFVTAAGQVKVLDFGIAKVLGSNVTEAGTLKGKTQYMSPEHLLGKELDRRSDLFALGIVMFELATHQRLFKRDSDFLTAKAILEEPIARADAVDPAIPAAIADVIASALAREPAQRPADAKQLAQAIVDAMAAHGGVATPAEISAVVTATDELTAQRTRHAKVLDDARSRVSEVAITRPLRGEATTIDPPRSVWLAGWTRMVMIGLGVTIGLALVIAGIWRFAVSAAEHRPVIRNGSGAAIGSAAPNVTGPVPGYDLITGSGSATGSGPVTASGSGSDSASGSASRSDTATGSGSGSAWRSASGSAANHTGSGSDTAYGSDTASRSDFDTGPASRSASGSTVHHTGSASAAPREPKTGTFSIDSTPFATIFVDGKRIDVTPILGRALPAGRRRIRAVLADGRTKDFPIDVPAGKAAKPVVLTW